jgi:hypothetical protein
MHIFRHTELDTLVQLFGEPNGGGSDKSDLSWIIVLQDERSEEERIHVITIYDWKIGKNYCGDDGMDVEQNTNWNVGSHSKAGYHLLNRYIKQRLIEIGQTAIQKSA